MLFRSVHHTLLDIGASTIDEIESKNLYPKFFPVEWLVLSHSHPNHFIGIDALCSNLKRKQISKPLKVYSNVETYEQSVGTFFPYLKNSTIHQAAVPGLSQNLWADGSARFNVVPIEVKHFKRSLAYVFSFFDGEYTTIKIAALLDIEDFNFSGYLQSKADSNAINPIFDELDLLIADASNWRDPSISSGNSNGHIWFEKLASHICEWAPEKVRLVHYNGYEDMKSNEKLYSALIFDEKRIHPSQGPVSNWELTASAQEYLYDLGFINTSEVKAAYSGETISMYPLKSNRDEFYPIVRMSPVGELEVTGNAPARIAHQFGIPHPTTVLIPIVTPENGGDKKILLHKRSPYKRICPNTWDFGGGHVRMSGKILNPRHWKDSSIIAESIHKTAIRESNEEFICDPYHIFNLQDIYLLSKMGEFTIGLNHPGTGNIEYSTIYGVKIPANTTIKISDTDIYGKRELETKQVTLEELIAAYERDKSAFADGAGRVLEKILENRKNNNINFEKEFRALLKS
mgnify:CR=1 FL=1